jgi:RNA polymerase-binding transcription factor DksA
VGLSRSRKDVAKTLAEAASLPGDHYSVCNHCGNMAIAMTPSPRRLRSLCPHCQDRQSLSPSELAARLRSLGMLKRDDEQSLEMLLALADAARLRLVCQACGSGGLDVEREPDDEWEASGKACAACGAAIPSERLELFPASDLCAACQARVDQGQTPDQHDDYCPHCGTRMIVRQRRGSGIAGYAMICPACGR